MTRKEIIPVTIISTLLLTYCMLILSGSVFWLVNIIFLASPFLMIWLLYSVIRYGKYDGRELKEDEEWGYADKEKLNQRG